MKEKEIQVLIDKYVAEDPELKAVIVYDKKLGKPIASTLNPNETKEQIRISQLAAKTDEAANKIDPEGVFRWDMVSFSRKIITCVRIHKEIFVDCLYAPEKAPSGAIEDALEIALDVGEFL